MNPYDLYAIEMALTLAEKYNGEVTSVTMGPPQAKNVILDRKFAGADVLSTAYTLSQGIKKCGDFDIIICGKQTKDGDTAQVGAEVSEFLDIPNVANVISVEEIKDNKIYLTSSLDDRVM